MRPPRLDTARIFERVFSIYRAEAKVLLPAAALLYVIPSALRVANGLTAQALSLAGAFIAAVVLQGLVVQTVRDVQDGRRDMSFVQLFRSISPVFAPLLWTAMLVAVGVFAGILLFIVPGLILFTQWAVASPVVVVEKQHAFKAVSRSSQLVRGRAWQVFSVLVVTFLIVVVASLVVAAGISAIYSTNATLAVGGLIANTLTAPIFALAVAQLYLELLALHGEPLLGQTSR